MRVDTVIDALRPFITGIVSAADLARAQGLVREFDSLSTQAVLEATEPVVISIGAKEGQVLFQTTGNDLVEPMFLVWDIDGAKTVIEAIKKAIELAEGQRQ